MLERMPIAAPRLDSRLVAAIELLDDERLPIAEVNRRVGRVALRTGLPKPSYEQVRVHVHLTRRLGRAPGTGQVLLEIMLRTRAPEELLDQLAGTGVRDLNAKLTDCYLAFARAANTAKLVRDAAVDAHEALQPRIVQSASFPARYTVFRCHKVGMLATGWSPPRLVPASASQAPAPS